MNESAKQLQNHLEQMQASLNSQQSWKEKISAFRKLLSESGELAMTSGFPGLLDICMLFGDCLDTWLEQNNEKDPDEMDFAVLCSWPEAVKDYILSPNTGEHKETLMQLISYPAWGSNISEDDAVMLKQLLDIQIETSANTELGLDEQNDTTGQITTEKQTDIQINQDLPAETRELVTILYTELQNILATIHQLTSLLSSSSDKTSPESDRLLHEITQMLEFYNDAVNSIGFEGFGKIVSLVRTNIEKISNDVSGQISFCSLLSEWVEQVSDYLKDPTASAGAEALTKFMHDKRWYQPVTDEQDQTYISSLLAIPVESTSTGKPSRPVHATSEDVSLELPEDVDQDLLEAMLQELPGQSEELSNALQRLNNDGTLEDILVAKRIAHTLKGAGNTVGIRGIATLTHYLEDILLELHKHEIMPPPHVMQLLMNASDCLAIMSESLLGLGDPPDDALMVLQEVLDMANSIDQKGVAVLKDENVAQKTVNRAKATDSGPDNQEDTKSVSDEREPVAMLRVPATFIDNLLRLIGESKIMTSQINNFIQETQGQINNMQECFDHLKNLGNKVQELTDIKDLNRILQNKKYGTAYDSLEMDQYTELHTYSKWLVETTVDAYETNQDVSSNLTRLRNMLADQTQINNETQENVIRARMLRADTHFQRLQRCVRQAAKLTGKPVDLILEGGEVMLDSETLNALLDPLMHLLRNAVDHGIETREERLANNKPETGKIILTFTREGNNILVQCRDDGRGLDLESIHRKAVTEGLLQEDQEVTDAELKQFILRPNFSTKQETTQVSGRGIGMDAVYASISALSGIMVLDSEAGQGCSIQIRLPQNTLSIFALLIRVGLRLMVIANRDIDRIVHHENGRLNKQGKKWKFKTENREYPALPIEELLNTYADRRSQERLSRTAILYRTETGITAVMVEKILGSGDFVVKGLGEYLPKIPGILGVTLLGDGTVTPVVDAADLLRLPISSRANGRYIRTEYIKPQLPVALVVDDSLSARRALTQFMQDAGFEVRQARDGIEAMDIIKAHKPDIVLSDLEMPRMNGIELTSHIRADKNTIDVPVIMITSRAAAKHRDEAMTTGVNVYLTKPYGEDQLMEEIRKLHHQDSTSSAH